MEMLLLWAAAAWGQAVQTDRPVVPSSTTAAEGGPGALWVNPANLAYDPDRRYGLWVASEIDGATALAAAWGAQGVNLGASTRIDEAGASDWSVDYAMAIPLPSRFALGGRVAWHLLEGERNYVSADAAASWRPLPWIGAGVVFRNIGSPDPTAPARTGGGLALRPFDDAVILGADYLRTFPSDDPTPDLPEEVGVFSVRVRPAQGLYLRASADTERSFGAGLEVYFGGAGVGVHGGQAAESLGGRVGAVAWIGSDEPGERLVRSGRRLVTLDLRQMPDYVPERELFARADPSWLDTLELLRRVERDGAVRGVVVTLGVERTSLARYSELRDRFTALRAAGKTVVVYLYGTPGNGAYYAASSANAVYLHPASHLDLTGLSSSMVHLAGMLDLVGVQAQFVQRSEYKAASEPFTRTDPSPWQLEQSEALLDDLYAELVAGIAAGRGVTEDQVRDWIDAGPWIGREAHEAGLVDGRAYPDELERELEDLLGAEFGARRLSDVPQPHSAWETPTQIAVIYVESTIVTGPSDPGGLLSARTAGSHTVAEQLSDARRDPQVRAVVLRVDSPGGSAFASDEIWRAAERVQAAGKPVVVSMGGVAASGGYYVSTGADAIWADPTTVTGSIGVVSGKFNAADLMDRVGVSATTLTRGANADTDSPLTAWDGVQLDRAQARVDDVYGRFTAKVGQGRGLDADEVESVARGRVWSGRAASEVGLVDRLGGFQAAIADARERAGIPPWREVALVTYRGRLQPAQALSPSLTGQVPAALQTLWGPMQLWSALADEDVLLLDPWLLEVHP